jgi:hypothetical protein
MKIKKLALLCVAISAMNVTSAHAFDISALGALTLSNFSGSDAPASSIGTSVGVGALIGTDFMPGFGIETGAFYMARSSSSTLVGIQFNSSYGVIEIPAMLRVTLIPLLIVEAGPYIGIPISASLSSGGVSLTSTKPNVDVGLKGGLGVSIPILPTLSLRGEGMYSLGLSNMSTGTGTLNARNIDILAGVTFGL